MASLYALREVWRLEQYTQLLKKGLWGTLRPFAWAFLASPPYRRTCSPSMSRTRMVLPSALLRASAIARAVLALIRWPLSADYPICRRFPLTDRLRPVNFAPKSVSWITRDMAIQLARYGLSTGLVVHYCVYTLWYATVYTKSGLYQYIP